MFFKQLIICALLLLSCDTGKLDLVADIPNHLKEVSAVETTSKSDLIWMIEDAGNNNHLYAMDDSGTIKKDITILNSKNTDWEDLTSDKDGNIYIGDFGNNSEKRNHFTIYKVINPDHAEKSTTAEKINFTIPDNLKSRNFEAFFLLDDYFYIFSKSKKTSDLIKVPNQIGNQLAQLVREFNLDGKHNKITSADVSDDGETIALLNHEKLWLISNYKPDEFFKGSIEELNFNHNSQKEGVCFKHKNAVYITDERNHSEGGNLYYFEIN